MTGTINFGGLLSGLDTQKIVEQLVNLRKVQRIDPINKRIAQIETQKLAMSPLLSSFQSTKAAAKVLKDASNDAYDVKKAISSDTDEVVITAVNADTAIAGTYDITQISQLAQADREIFEGKANKNASQFGTGTIVLTYNGTTTNVAITSSNNTLEGIMGAINSASAGVTASIINDGDASVPYRLVLTGNNTGSAYNITVSVGTVDLTLDSTASSAAANEQQSAKFRVNTVTVNSASNTVTDAVPGVTLELVDTETTNTIKITVTQDTAKVLSSISQFINGYNSTRKLISANISADKETGQFGPLGHDVTLINAYVQLHSIFGRRFNGLTGYAYKDLTDIGINYNVNGELSVDTGKLTSAIESNLTSVRLLFQGAGSEDGIAEDMHDYLENITKPDGVFFDKNDNFTRQILRMKERLKDHEKQLDLYRQQLSSKFVLLEKRIGALESQRSQIESFSNVYSGGSNKLL